MTAKPLNLLDREIGIEIRDAAQYARLREEVLEEHLKRDSRFQAELARLERVGINPTDWLNVKSVPAAFILDDEKDAALLITQVFNQCGLDHRKPRHWRVLLELLIDHCFRGAGRLPKWDEGGLSELLSDIRDVKKRFVDAKTDSQIAKMLIKKKPYKDKYEQFKVDTLRKQVGRALDPAITPEAAHSEDHDWILARAERAAKEYGLQTEVGIDLQMRTLVQIFVDQGRERLIESHLKEGKVLTEEIWQTEYEFAVQEWAQKEAENTRNGLFR